MRSINNIVLLACLLFCFSACRKNEGVKADTPGMVNFTMQNVTGELKIAFVKDAVTPGYMEILNDEEDRKFREYLAAGYPETAGAIVKLMNFHVTGNGERRYLIFEGYNRNTKSNRSFAYPIVLNEDGVSASFAIPGMTVNGRLAASADSETHSCSGIPCSCCAFVYSGSNIIGCQCNGGYPGCEFRSGDFCSHSVSGGTNPPPGGGGTNPPPGGGTGGGGTVPAWGQCGGQGYTGPVQCVGGYTCKMVNLFYSQCVL